MKHQHLNERVDIEMQIVRYRALARTTLDDSAKKSINTLVFELEHKLRQIDD